MRASTALLAEYRRYYNRSGIHLALAKNAPDGRSTATERGAVVATPVLGGVHHVYARLAA
jgi:hypothetical protein